MRALIVEPGRHGPPTVAEVPDAVAGPADLLVEGLAIGVCGTDREIANGEYGWAPPGQRCLVLGHESLGRVVTAPPGSEFSPGELVVGVVRRPDPVPCGACAHGDFDMCRNGRYTERGIKELDGFGSELWRVEADYAVALAADLAPVGALMEPTTVVAKAWEQVEAVGARSWFDPRRVLVTGAGPIGLLAAMLGAQRGLDVHVLDRVTSGPKPGLVEALGATYHHDAADRVMARLTPDVVIEATGAGEVVFDVMTGNAPYGIVCLTGVASSSTRVGVDASRLNRELVLENDVVLGSVNANLRHFRQAADALAKADLAWLDRIITRRVPLSRAAAALTAEPDDVKVVVTLAG